MTKDFRIAAIYSTVEGEHRCLVFGGRGDMLAGRPGATGFAIAEADPTFDPTKSFISLCLDEGVSLRAMDPAWGADGYGRSLPRAYVEYPWTMTPRPLEGDREWDGWPWR